MVREVCFRLAIFCCMNQARASKDQFFTLSLFVYGKEEEATHESPHVLEPLLRHAVVEVHAVQVVQLQTLILVLVLIRGGTSCSGLLGVLRQEGGDLGWREQEGQERKVPFRVRPSTGTQSGG